MKDRGQQIRLADLWSGTEFRSKNEIEYQDSKFGWQIKLPSIVVSSRPDAQCEIDRDIGMQCAQRLQSRIQSSAVDGVHPRTTQIVST